MAFYEGISRLLLREATTGPLASSALPQAPSTRRRDGILRVRASFASFGYESLERRYASRRRGLPRASPRQVTPRRLAVGARSPHALRARALRARERLVLQGVRAERPRTSGRGSSRSRAGREGVGDGRVAVDVPVDEAGLRARRGNDIPWKLVWNDIHGTLFFIFERTQGTRLRCERGCEDRGNPRRPRLFQVRAACAQRLNVRVLRS